MGKGLNTVDSGCSVEKNKGLSECEGKPDPEGEERKTEGWAYAMKVGTQETG